MFSAVLAIKGALALSGLVLLAGIVAGVPRFRVDAPVFFASYLAVIGNALFPLWYFQGIEQMRYITIVTGVARVLTAGALFLFVRGPGDYLAAALLLAAGPVLAGIVGLWVAVVQFGVRPLPPRRDDCVRALREGWHLFVSTAAVTLYSNTNVFLVGLIAGNLQAGFFAAGEKIVRGVLSFLTPVTQSIYPHVNVLAARSRAEALRFIQRTIGWIGGLSFLASLALLCLAHLVVTICFGRASSETSVTVVRWIALLPFIVAMGNVLGVQTMIPFGLAREFSWILVVAGVLNVATAVPFIAHLGAPGAAIALLCAETFVTVTMLAVLGRHGINVIARGGVVS
jgi:PST family polysaccharide transporter